MGWRLSLEAVEGKELSPGVSTVSGGTLSGLTQSLMGHSMRL